MHVRQIHHTPWWHTPQHTTTTTERKRRHEMVLEGPPSGNYTICIRMLMLIRQNVMPENKIKVELHEHETSTLPFFIFDILQILLLAATFDSFNLFSTKFSKLFPNTTHTQTIWHVLTPSHLPIPHPLPILSMHPNLPLRFIIQFSKDFKRFLIKIMVRPADASTNSSQTNKNGKLKVEKKKVS